MRTSFIRVAATALDGLQGSAGAAECLEVLTETLAGCGGWSDVRAWPYDGDGSGPTDQRTPAEVAAAIGQADVTTAGGFTVVPVYVDTVPLGAVTAHVDPATDELGPDGAAVLARMTGLVAARHREHARQGHLTASTAAINQVMEAVAAATTPAEVAQAALAILVAGFGWDGGVVLQRQPERSAAAGETDLLLELPSGAIVLAERTTEPPGLVVLDEIGTSGAGLKGSAVGRPLPDGITHALVWPLHAATGTDIILFGEGPAGLIDGFSQVLQPVAQIATVARAGIERVEQTARQHSALAAERANKAKSEFLSRMSHELRTPLNSVIGFAQLLEMEELDDDAMESVAQIRKAGDHLLALVNEALDIAKIEAGRLTMSLEPVELLDLVNESRGLVVTLATHRAITLTVDEGTLAGRWVLADRQRLKQVLLNLLSNSIKYNRDGGTVTVSAHDEDGGEIAALLVADSGRGIAPDKMTRLFTPFDRLGAETGTTEGTGLGLALSQRLAEVMGGGLTATSTLGEGTVFTLKLATSTSLDKAADSIVDAAGIVDDDARGTVLYIEDNLPNLKLVQRILHKRPGVNLLHALHGTLGLELARAHRPHLILLDLDLPDIHGSQVLDLLRADPLTRDIPVIAVSADATPGQIRRLLEAGAVHYLTKPLEVVEFLDVVDQQLERRGQKEPPRSTQGTPRSRA